MKTKQIILIVLTLLLTTGMAFCTESQTTENRSVIGVALDSRPLPELLVKHLNLKPGQGIRIGNVMKGSAADEAGLERDDIVIGFQGKDVYDGATLTNEVRQAGVGTEASLDIIHLGQRKNIKLKLKAVMSAPDWKYPDEPQIEQVFQPGRVFRFGPGDQSWIEIDQVPDDIKTDINTYFNQLYTSYYNVNGKQYSVTIEGNPENKDSKITVKIDNNEYKTTAGELDKLPEEYREAAKNAIENAKQKKSIKIKITPSFPDDFGDTFLPGMRSQGPQLKLPNNFNSSIFDRLEEQMKQMQERMKELEKNQKNFLDRLNEKEKQQ